MDTSFAICLCIHLHYSDAEGDLKSRRTGIHQQKRRALRSADTDRARAGKASASRESDPPFSERAQHRARDADHGILSPSAPFRRAHNAAPSAYEDPPQSPFKTRDYATRIDSFRRAERLSIAAWAKTAEINRAQLRRYRAGEIEPGLDVLARLIAGASKLAGRTVQSFELYELGEEEPVPDRPAPPHARSVMRKIYESRLDEFLLTHHVLPAALARATGLSRQALLRLRSGRSTPIVSTARAIVVALRRMGHAVVAADLWEFDRKQRTRRIRH